MDALWIALAMLTLASLAATAVGWRNLARTRRLRDVPIEGVSVWPRVTVVMAARNEAARIGPAIASRLRDDYPDLELILVDDRSDDGTGRTALDAAGRDPRLRVVRVDDLPDGWLGKVHALREGERVATGEFLLFSDADVTVWPDATRRAVALAQADDLDCVGLVPEYRSGSVLVDATWAVFIRAMALALDPDRIADPRSRMVVGSGAFTLVRRAAFERTGGFEHLRMETGDDMALAAMLKAAGGRCAGVVGVGCAVVRMYDSAGSFLRGVEKNGSTTAAKPVSSIAGILTFAIVDWAPLVALLAGPAWLRALGAVATVLAFAWNVVALRTTSRLAAPALLWPLGTALFALGTIRSTLLALSRGGIVWRGTFYPLAELEAGRRFTL